MTNWKLIARFITGQGTADDRAKAEQWMHADARRQKFIDALFRFFKKDQVDFNPYKDEDWKKIMAAYQGEEAQVVPLHAGRTKFMLRIAASVLVMIAAGLSAFYFFYKARQQESFQVLYQAKEVPQNIFLADGTRVFLNKHTTLRVSSVFGERTRDVILDGEAFFEVTKDPLSPFRVTADQLKIKVLGTSFNIQCDPGKDSTVTVTVEEGKVSVSEKDDPEKGKQLSASEAVVYSTRTKLGDIVQPDLNYLAWKTGIVRFRDTSLREVCPFLSKHYGIDLRVSDPSLEHLKITTVLDNLPYTEVLNVIALTLDLHVRQEGSTFLLAP